MTLADVSLQEDTMADRPLIPLRSTFACQPSINSIRLKTSPQQF